MKCPRCMNQLKPVSLEDIVLDVCEACEGIWFDKNELETICRLEEQQLLSSEISKSLVKDHHFSQTAYKDRLLCPRCSAPMKSYIYSYDSGICLDNCQLCGGIWVDDGELKEIIDYIYEHEYEPEINVENNQEINEKALSIRKKIDQRELHDSWELFLRGLLNRSIDAINLFGQSRKNYPL